MKVWVLLPAYNEEAALESLVVRIDQVLGEAGLDYRVFVVNDGSRDGTQRILDDLSGRFPLDFLTHRFNRGLGQTARDGFEHLAAVAARDDVIVRLDCDGSHDPAYIPALLQKLADGYEVAIASRYAPGGGQVGLNLYRRTISRIANLLLKSLFPIRGIWEYSCGFRAYRVAVIQDAIDIFENHFIHLTGMGFTGTVEKLVKLRMMQARIGAVPFVLRYDLKESTSKVVTSLTTLGYFVLIAKYRWMWGGLGRDWRRAIEARKTRTYAADGRLRDSVLSTEAG